MRDDVMFRNEIRRFLGRKNLKLIIEITDTDSIIIKFKNWEQLNNLPNSQNNLNKKIHKTISNRSQINIKI